MFFKVQYLAQNGEEIDSSEELTYDQVARGRSFYQIYYKNLLSKSKVERRKLQATKKAQDEKKMNDDYDLLSGGGDELEYSNHDDNQSDGLLDSGKTGSTGSRTRGPVRCSSRSDNITSTSTSSSSSSCSITRDWSGFTCEHCKKVGLHCSRYCPDRQA